MDDQDNMLSSSGISRRSFIKGSALGLFGLGLSALGLTSSSSASQKVTVSVWDLFSGADGANTRAMIESIVQEHPGLFVAPTTLSWGNPYYTKLAMASASGAPPSTAIMHVSCLVSHLEALLSRGT